MLRKRVRLPSSSKPLPVPRLSSLKTPKKDTLEALDSLLLLRLLILAVLTILIMDVMVTVANEATDVEPTNTLFVDFF